MGSGLSVMPSDPQFWIAAGKIAWINILLASGSAVVIALVCRSLALRERKAAILLGAGAAVLLPILLAGVVAQASPPSFLKLFGGIALLLIAIELIVAGGGHEEKPAANVWRAVRIVVIATVAISLDVTVTTATATRIDVLPLALALVISFALIAGGATLLTGLFARLPILAWPGAALIGWIAGAIISKDPAVAGSANLFVAAAAGALLVVVIAERLTYLRAVHSRDAPPATATPRTIHRYRL